MRVSTQGKYLTGLSAMQQLQAALDRTQRQISSGRRILKPSDDPIAAGRAIELRESVSRLAQFDRNAGMASNRLAYEESTLNGVNNVLQRVRELALQANNATQSNETRALIAVEMRQGLQQLVQLANEKDGNGHYLFAGNLVDTKPVSMSGGNYTYNGDQGQRLIQIAEGRYVANGDSGADVFFMIREGNGTFAVSPAATNTGSGVAGAGSVADPVLYDGNPYTIRFTGPGAYDVLDSTATVVSSGTFQPGATIAFQGIELTIDGQPSTGDEFAVNPSANRDVFSAIDELVSAIELRVDDEASRATLNNGVNAGLLRIDQAIGNVLEVRTEIGSRMAAIESQVDTNEAVALGVQETLAELQDLDYAEAISRLSLQLTTLEAAQQSFVSTQSLSLFNYF